MTHEASNPHYRIRRANRADAAAAVELLRASITQLCAAEHRNDPATLERWLQNKTIEHLERWIDDPANFIVVVLAAANPNAEIAGGLLGIGLINQRGVIHLCYVRPGHTRSGVGSAILGALEARAVELGLTETQLTSTANGRAFYEHHGYKAWAEPRTAFGVLVEYPYQKRLSTPVAEKRG